MREILGHPQIWWPNLRDAENRIKLKNFLQIINFAWTILLVNLRIRGAKSITLQNQEKALKLSRKNNLGLRNDIIHIEPDNVIYKSVTLTGEWGKTESEFLSSFCNQKTTLIDLGANIGLISKQILNLSTNVCRVLVVEPRFVTMLNLKMNLSKITESKRSEIIFCQFALSDTNGHSFLYTEPGNIGNSSLKKELTLISSFEEVETLTSGKFYEKYLFHDEIYILKSDLQGMDAAVLNAFPSKIWNQVIAAVIEVWPSKVVKKADISDLSKKLTDRFECSFSPVFLELLNFRNLVEYWMNADNKSQNLYIRKMS
jgi:FkbM family methyltransferase